MNLFEAIPGNFFSVLSSKNKELYADALMILNRLFHYELIIKTSDFIAALIDLLENRNYEIEEDDEITEGGLTINVKARLILSRFVKTGWVDREYMDGSFTEVITPRVYAIRVMQLLQNLSNEQINEYNSLVFSTFSGLKEAHDNQTDQIYEAVLNAKSNTEKLVSELKTLYHGIRSYLRKIQGQKDINILLRDHFDEYKSLADRIYHPIKTMDSIYRYMAPIREIIFSIQNNQEIMESMRKRAISIRRYENEEEAGLEIINAMDYILDIYQSLGNIVGEIDKKHSNYTKLSIDTIRYHMSADQTISGKLVALLKNYSISTGSKRSRLLGLMESKVRVNRQDFIDGNSLWRRNARSRRLSTEPLVLNDDARLSEAESEFLLKSFNNDYSLHHVKQFMINLFGNNDSFSTEEMEIPDDREFIMLLLSAIRAGERNTDFKAQVSASLININGYKIPKIIFTRKKERDKHVE